MMARLIGAIQAIILCSMENLQVISSYASSDIFRLQAWGKVVDAIAKNLHGKGAIKSPEVEHVLVAEASRHHPWAGLMWGGNCRSRGERLRNLGWKSIGPSIYESLSWMTDEEIKLANGQ